jgi:hypothetical protein
MIVLVEILCSRSILRRWNVLQRFLTIQACSYTGLVIVFFFPWLFNLQPMLFFLLFISGIIIIKIGKLYIRNKSRRWGKHSEFYQLFLFLLIFRFPHLFSSPYLIFSWSQISIAPKIYLFALNSFITCMFYYWIEMYLNMLALHG